MRIAICDDSNEYIKTIENYIEKLNIKNIDYDVYYSGEELVYAFENKNVSYDAIFLDMEMGELDGIETANKIRFVDKYVIIVFVTSHTKYMQRSFQCMPFRFLIKPVDFDEFKEVYSEICTKVQENPETFIFLENKKRTRIYCSDIIFFESSGHQILIHTSAGEIHKIRKTMTELLKSVENSTFIRTHRAFAVNLKHIYQISELEIAVHFLDKVIPIGRTYKNDLEEAFLNFKERKYLI